MAMDSKTSKSMCVAVVGGGIGGLSAGVALHSHGFDVTIFEQAPVLGEVGAGVFIFPNGLRQLERLGFGEALAKVGGKINSNSSYFRMDGSVVGPIPIADSSGWNGLYGMHRADLLSTLESALPPAKIRTGFRCTKIEQNADSVRLSFANGEIFDADVVVAADGLKSTVQSYVVEPAQPEYSGSRAYRGLLPAEAVPWKNDSHKIWMGDGKHFMAFPVRAGRLINYVGFVPTVGETEESWSAIGDPDELRASFAGWDERVLEMLDKVESCFWWGLYDRKPLAAWTRGRVILLGDAAHPMLPHLGQGANQTIEDAAALPIFLDRGKSDDIPNTLQDFERFRRKRTDFVQSEARRNGLRYDSRSGDISTRDREIANAAELRKWLYDYDVEKDALAHLNG
jgi:salicylate hydroxylase